MLKFLDSTVTFIHTYFDHVYKTVLFKLCYTYQTLSVENLRKTCIP